LSLKTAKEVAAKSRKTSKNRDFQGQDTHPVGESAAQAELNLSLSF
jgi:hypothetical protein